jgi:dihydrofolate reductase
MGFPIVMGRRTFESIGRPLPGRRSLVISRNREFTAQGIELFSSFENAIHAASEARHVFVIGGGEIYTIAIPLASRIHRTLVDVTLDGDTYFPNVDWACWELTHQASVPASEIDEYGSTYEVFDRRVAN